MRRRLSWLVMSVLLLASRAVSAEDDGIALPPGFQIEVFASVAGARFMTLDPAGTLLVSRTQHGEIVALRDRRGTGRADDIRTVAAGLDLPHGLAFLNGSLYVAETGRVLRFHYTVASSRASDAIVVAGGFPAGGVHASRTIVFGRDERLYLSVGSSCNVCLEGDPHRAAITRYMPDGSGQRRFATGLRNAVGLAFDPGGRLWATVNERDGRGDELPPDYVTEVTDGGFYGWPSCFTAQRSLIPDPEVGATVAACRRVTRPTIELPAHSAPLGLTFYTGHAFPPAYRGSLFVAYHGSSNRTVPRGYKVVRIPFRNGQPGAVEDFATGWLRGRQVLGRPVGLQTGRDGALYVSDDTAGKIYRITYRSPRTW